MTKQEQIEEMRKEIENGFQKADCRKAYTNEPYPYFETQKTAIAEALYDAGYRKVPDGAVVLTPEERDDLKEKVESLKSEKEGWKMRYSDSGQKNKKLSIKNAQLKAENKQLKTECALLDDELRIARQGTIDVLNKLKDYVNQLACDEYGDSACDTNYITIDIDKYEQDIDEMLKEYGK